MGAEAPTIDAVPTGEHYARYAIATKPTPNIDSHPHRFDVQVSKVGLAKLLITEALHYRNAEVVLSRPCLYGVFSGPVGGFSPRPHLCVGCLRCTTQYPDMVKISPNPERQELGDSYFTPDFVDTAIFESSQGTVPVRGAGYRGKFSGEGFDGMWTDMSEIVRPTRDGIHGREFISTVVDIGAKPTRLQFNEESKLVGEEPHTFSLPLPILFDTPPRTDQPRIVQSILGETARQIKTLSLIPLEDLLKMDDVGPHFVPIITRYNQKFLTNSSLPFVPKMVEIEDDPKIAGEVWSNFPGSVTCARLPLNSETADRINQLIDAGVGVFHVVADYHGRGEDDRFIMDHVQKIHTELVRNGRRDEITLIGSGGIIAAEHVPKALLSGLDAVAIDTTPMVALQGKFDDVCRNPQFSYFNLPKNIDVAWGVQRLANLSASWRDQLLEIMGAMGMREARRLRGEMGRAMLAADLEKEAFGDIDGYYGKSAQP